MQKHFFKENSTIAKGVAILFMLIYHLFQSEFLVPLMNVDHRPFSAEGFDTLADFGKICVAIFIFITSFGISTGLFAQENISAKEAYSQAAKRFFSLMGNFFLLYVCVNLLWWYKLDYAAVYGVGKQGLLHLLLDSVGLSNFMGTPLLNVTWWYMEIAYLLILIVPLMALGMKKIGYPFVLLCLALPFTIEINPDIAHYYLTIVLGVCFAYGKWFDKLMSARIPAILHWIVGCAGFVGCILVRENKVVFENYLYIADAFIAVFLVYFAGILLASVPVLKTLLHFIGKHSMNIYLVHTFFYLILWQDFIYSFHYAGLILLVLLALCLLFSVLLELLKSLLIKAWRRIRP
ncbi:MAG: acyltransferase family protein [Lachnospiraceae bacterium]|nr:acyltransferase family protein [Lachnospiraceae bacterium]